MRESDMDAKLQKRVQRYGWDKAAAHYERSWRAQLEPAQTALLDLIQLAPAERVLDVACGTGLLTFKAASLVAPTGEVIGTDISEEMVKTAQDMGRAQGITNVAFERMDAEQLSFGDSSFDAALCALGLMYAPDPERAIAEMHRVSKPGGRVACVVWGERRKCGWAEIFPIVDARVQSEVCPMFFRLGTGEVLQRAMQAAGFRDVACRRLETLLNYPDDAEACEAAFFGGPVALAYNRFPQQVRAEAHEEYLRSIAPYRQSAGYAIPGEFVVVVGTT
jgi:ubiquinone/menaquinone biosynthesis C-methylase UbiE